MAKNKQGYVDVGKGRRVDDWGSCTKNLGQWGPDHDEWKWDGETDGPWDYVLGTVPVDEQKNRALPNSDPGGDDNMTYQRQPWDCGEEMGQYTDGEGNAEYKDHDD